MIPKSPRNPIPKKHSMELPRRILIGPGVLRELAKVLSELGLSGPVLLVSGQHVIDTVRVIVENSLQAREFTYDWTTISAPTRKDVRKVVHAARVLQAKVIVGIGGGKSVDVAKLASGTIGVQFVSVPTSASHDGISSPFVSLKDLKKPYSVVAQSPMGIIADLDIIGKAPGELLLSGCGDLLAKITAVRDWELSAKKKGEYYGKYAAELALLSAEMVMKEAERIGSRSTSGIRDVLEALISAGVAAGIAGSSRPCSGSEHLFSHALDVVAPNHGLHGEQCGLGTIMMAKLHGIEWQSIVTTLERLGGHTQASQLGLSEEDIVKSLLLAPSIRPERYTILNMARLTREKALQLATSTGVC